MFQTLNLKVFNHFHILQIHRFQRLLDAGFTYFSLDQQIWTVGLENYSFHEGESICLAAKLTNVLIPNKFFNRIWLWNLPPPSLSSSPSTSPFNSTLSLHLARHQRQKNLYTVRWNISWSCIMFSLINYHSLHLHACTCTHVMFSQIDFIGTHFHFIQAHWHLQDALCWIALWHSSITHP